MCRRALADAGKVPPPARPPCAFVFCASPEPREALIELLPFFDPPPEPEGINEVGAVDPFERDGSCPLPEWVVVAPRRSSNIEVW